MGYPTYFWTSDQATPGCVEFTETCSADHGHLVVGMYAIPILWSMCFSSADINTQIIEPGPDDDESEGEPLYGASCDTTRQNAVANLERRMPSLLKIIPQNTHEVARLFVDRLRNSAKGFVHLDLSTHVAEERAPEIDWRGYWGEELDGLDTVVSTVRGGPSRFVLGTGIPSHWKHLCRCADGPTLNPFKSFSFTPEKIAGETLRGLLEWQA